MSIITNSYNQKNLEKVAEFSTSCDREENKLFELTSRIKSAVFSSLIMVVFSIIAPLQIKPYIFSIICIYNAIVIYFILQINKANIRRLTVVAFGDTESMSSINFWLVLEAVFSGSMLLFSTLLIKQFGLIQVQYLPFLFVVSWSFLSFRVQNNTWFEHYNQVEKDLEIIVDFDNHQESKKLILDIIKPEEKVKRIYRINNNREIYSVISFLLFGLLIFLL